MALLVSVIRLSHLPDATELQAFEEAHRKVFGTASDVPKILPDPNDPNQAAVVGEVHDLDAMRAISRTPEGDAMMRRFGFLEQLSYFLEES